MPTFIHKHTNQLDAAISISGSRMTAYGHAPASIEPRRRRAARTHRSRRALRQAGTLQQTTGGMLITGRAAVGETEIAVSGNCTLGET